jgi:hypothetical protein
MSVRAAWSGACARQMRVALGLGKVEAIILNDYGVLGTIFAHYDHLHKRNHMVRTQPAGPNCERAQRVPCVRCSSAQSVDSLAAAELACVCV